MPQESTEKQKGERKIKVIVTIYSQFCFLRFCVKMLLLEGHLHSIMWVTFKWRRRLNQLLWLREGRVYFNGCVQIWI